MATLRDRLDLFVRQFAQAVRRSTRLNAGDVAAAPGADEALERTSARHLPGAGWLVGLLAAFVFALVGLLLRSNPAGPAVAAVASLFAVLLLTGAAEESAVFRLAERLEARAARGGSGHGVIALVLLLAGRIAAVAALGTVSEPAVLAALFAAPVVARFAPLPAAHWSGHGGVDRAGLGIAALWCVVPLLLMLLAEGPAFLLLALLGAAVGWIAMLRCLRRWPGSFDDERIAALQQACELSFYLGAVIGA